MASKFGRVLERPGRRASWCIDLGRAARPRYLYSARGARFESGEMARAVLDAIRVKIAKGVDPQAAVDEFAPATSERNGVEHWAAEYLEEQTELTEQGELSPTHLRELRRCVRKDGLWSWWWGRSLGEIDALSVAQFAKALRRREFSPKTVRNILGYFRAFLTWLARMERLDRVPVFPVVRVKDHRPTILSPRTQGLVLAEIPRELRGVFLAACHGIRPGELRALGLRDLEARNGVPGIVVSRAMKGPNANAVVGGTKTGDASWVPIDEELAEWVAWRLEQEEPVAFRSPALFPNPFALPGPNPEYRWTANKLREVWNGAAAAVGVQVKMYEGTKHSSATAWRTSGMSLELVRRMLRHRDARSTERYGKLADGALVEAFRRTRSARE